MQQLKPLLLLALLGLIVISFFVAQNALTNDKDPSQVDSTSTIITYSDKIFFNAPEYDMGGGLVAMVACLGAFALFKKRQK
ncbi:MAG: hypothetical protein NWE92_12515 [Candidatus Bathyarchaeota archaeon]|nr:hypothetical protein [Candidatus Bathyarchaeota archaeon]